MVMIYFAFGVSYDDNSCNDSSCDTFLSGMPRSDWTNIKPCIGGTRAVDKVIDNIDYADTVPDIEGEEYVGIPGIYNRDIDILTDGIPHNRDIHEPFRGKSNTSRY
jgi:hypothetical protein